MTSETRSAANKVHKEINLWKDYQAAFEAAGYDEETIRDTIEGEVDLKETLLAIAELIAERDCDVVAIKKRIDDLTIRKRRHESAIEQLRTIILSAMETVELKSIKGPLITLTSSNTPPKIHIEDETKIPVKFWKRKDPEIDKAAIKKALQEGQEVQGACLGNGGVTLTIRKS